MTRTGRFGQVIKITASESRAVHESFQQWRYRSANIVVTRQRFETMYFATRNYRHQSCRNGVCRSVGNASLARITHDTTY